MNLREQIIEAGKKFSVAITGGGTKFIDSFLAPGGASSVFNGAVVPYASELFDCFAGQPEKYCSREAALLLADKAYRLCDSNDYGVGVTATLRKAGPEREGRRHFFHIAIRGTNSLFYYTREFSDDYYREEQEEIVTSYIYLALGEVLGLMNKLNDTKQYIEASPLIWEMFDSRSSRMNLTRPDDGSFVPVALPKDLAPVVLFPGSFNPWHDGHAAMAQKAHEITGQSVMLELSVRNADKADLDILQFQERYLKLVGAIDGFKPVQWIAVSNNARFCDKARWLNNSTIVVGFDTILRIGDWERYYENFEYQDFIAAMKENGNKFLVFHRLTDEADIEKIEPTLRALCSFATMDEKFQRISSTDKR